MRSLIKSQIEDVKVNESSKGIEELSETIISRVHDFREMTSTIEAGSKAAKNQKNIRRKAFIDLMKYLQYLGLSPRCAQRLKYQREPSYTFGQEKVDVEEAFGTDFEKSGTTFAHPKLESILHLAKRSHDYFHRNLAIISKARDSSRALSLDLKETERDKCLSYLEDLLHLAFEHRQLFASVTSTAHLLFAVARQMDTFSREQSLIKRFFRRQRFP
ncbi:hypothetical protein BC829DRAFT_248743 [Chytridium lagenaria]|nr:hypothetical protein BC829DRAFT_248743 [Chytridium lagenaria]